MPATTADIEEDRIIATASVNENESGILILQMAPPENDGRYLIKVSAPDLQNIRVRIIDKKGKLKNPADRDHCLQYMVAIGLLKGKLTAEDYEDEAAKNPLIDQLRQKMVIREDPVYTHDYLDPEKRSIANAVKIIFEDGSATEEIAVEYPLGHRRRREEGTPLLIEKIRSNLRTSYSDQQTDDLLNLFHDMEHLKALPVSSLMDAFLQRGASTRGP